MSEEALTLASSDIFLFVKYYTKSSRQNLIHCLRQQLKFSIIVLMQKIKNT